jgi:hypothetical protein
LVGIWLWIYVAIVTTFTKKLWSHFIYCNIHHTVLTNVQLFLLIKPFCSNVYEVVILQNVLKFSELYSPHPSHLIALIFFFNMIFYQSFENLKLVKHTKFCLHAWY